jgi:hypothetical protein
MHMSVQMYLALIVLLPLLELLVLFVIQVMSMYSDDESCTESDSFGEPDGNPNRSRTQHDLPDDLSAGGWPSPTVADQLPSPAGEPSADRLRESTFTCLRKRIGTRALLHERVPDTPGKQPGVR